MTFSYSVRIYYIRFHFPLTKPVLAYPRPLVVADSRMVKGPSPKAQAQKLPEFATIPS